MKRSFVEAVAPDARMPLPLPVEHIVRALSALVVDERIERIERAIASRIGSVVAVVESLADPHNAAAIIRTCDGLGIGEVHAIESNEKLLITTRVTRGCDKWMDLRRHTEATACVRSLHARGYTVLAADMRATVSLADVAKIDRVALAFSNEHRGVSDELRAAADGAFSVPMRGMVESYNVSVAAAMALYEATRGRAGDLPPAERDELRARFLMASVREPGLVLERYARERGLPFVGDPAAWARCDVSRNLRAHDPGRRSS